MHMALPTRRPSAPAYSSRSSRFPLPLPRRKRSIAFILLAILATWLLFSRIIGGSENMVTGSPPVVVVTVLDPEGYPVKYIEDIKENRMEYARRHGYMTFFPTIDDYELDASPTSWAKIPAMRHAYTVFPHATYLWYIDQNTLIMNPNLPIERHIMEPKRLDALMIKDQPIVPPDSVIRTFTHLHGDQIDFVLAQDQDGLAPSSFVLKRGDWAKFFLDTWFDPLYRSYNFQKAETHALEHIVQWHPTILSKLALVPQRIMNSYSRASNESSIYKDGDLTIRFVGCEQGGDRNCANEAEPFIQQVKTLYNA